VWPATNEDLTPASSDFAGTLISGIKVCLSRADKFKFCRANFLEQQLRHNSEFIKLSFYPLSFEFLIFKFQIKI